MFAAMVMVVVMVKWGNGFQEREGEAWMWLVAIVKALEYVS